MTFNESDFPPDIIEAYGIHTCHPDRFFREVGGLEDGILVNAAPADPAHYKDPPPTVDADIGRLERAGSARACDDLRRTRVLLKP